MDKSTYTPGAPERKAKPIMASEMVAKSTPMLNSLYEELIYLDEIAGELDPESNAKVDAQRQLLVAKIKELESNTSD